MQSIFNNVFELGIGLLPFLLILIAFVFVIVLMHKLLLSKQTLSATERLTRQTIMVLTYVVGIVALVISLPIDPSIRNQVLGLIGVLLSGMIAFSSTNVVSNIIAGIIIRFTTPFHTGDFVKIESHFGRVTHKGVLDTELQTEQRDLIRFTNSYVLAHPIKVVRSSGTIISVELSLGYELNHERIEKLLLAAAEETELTEPFVQITLLGDFSVGYRVSGLLTEIKSMISVRSKLMANVLDTLHADGIEIVSPSFMNQRRVDDLPPMIAPNHGTDKTRKAIESETTPSLEDLMFDKAEAAQSREKQELAIKKQIDGLETHSKTARPEHKEILQRQISLLEQRLDLLKKASKNHEP